MEIRNIKEAKINKNRIEYLYSTKNNRMFQLDDIVIENETVLEFLEMLLKNNHNLFLHNLQEAINNPKHEEFLSQKI